MKLAAGQFWPRRGRRWQRQYDALDSHTSARVSYARVRRLVVRAALFLIADEMVRKNNVTWYVLGSVPQTVSHTREQPQRVHIDLSRRSRFVHAVCSQVQC